VIDYLFYKKLLLDLAVYCTAAEVAARPQRKKALLEFEKYR